MEQRWAARTAFLLLVLTSSIATAAPKQTGQASLDLDTPGCPTSFDAPTCESRTSWTLSNTANTGTLVDPSGAPYNFEVTVTEGATTNLLVGSGDIVVSNSGSLSAQLSSVAVLLETWTPGQGNASGPSGDNWSVVASTIATESGDCEDLGIARTCYGEVAADGSSFLVLLDADNNDVIALVDVLPIPPTIDNDNDGLRDEDEVDGIDNDGDGAIDEDGACQDAVRIGFEYEFDLSALGLVGPGDPDNPADDLRIDVIATFGSAGQRGRSVASCTLDANCNGVFDIDDPGTPEVNESETSNIRSIQQRYVFDLPACTAMCDAVTLETGGAFSHDVACATVTTSGLVDQFGVDQGNSVLIQTAGEGTTTTFAIEGTVSCSDGDCGTNVSAEATLSGAECAGLIEVTSAPASFAVECAGETPEIQPGDFCTVDRFLLGIFLSFINYPPLDAATFTQLFPDGLIVGDPDGAGDGDQAYAILFTNSSTGFVPGLGQYLLIEGGFANTLTADVIDPSTTSAGELGVQLATAIWNVAVDAAALPWPIFGGNPNTFPPGTLGELRFTETAFCLSSALRQAVAGTGGGPLSVNELIELANLVISGQSGTWRGVDVQVSPGVPWVQFPNAFVPMNDIAFALSSFNTGFSNCFAVSSCFRVPGTVPPSPKCYIGIGGGFQQQFASGYLMQLNMITGNATVVGATGVFGDSGWSAISALAMNSAGQIYTMNVSASADLFQIDPTTGLGTFVASTGLYYPDALAFDANDVLYAISSTDDLYTVDTSTGATTLIGPVGASIRGMDFDPTTGILWGGHGGSPDLTIRDSIYTIDTTTGAATVVGQTGILVNGTVSPTPSLCFDNDGNLVASKGGGGADNVLISIDKATGAGTLLGPITLNGGQPLRAVAGMALQNAGSFVRPGGEMTVSGQGGSDHDGSAIMHALPTRMALFPNDPNPFNPSTRIRFDLSAAVGVSLRIYDASGRLVRELVRGQLPPGEHAVVWNGRGASGKTVSSGVYFYRLEAGDFADTQRMLLLK